MVTEFIQEVRLAVSVLSQLSIGYTVTRSAARKETEAQLKTAYQGHTVISVRLLFVFEVILHSCHSSPSILCSSLC